MCVVEVWLFFFAYLFFIDFPWFVNSFVFQYDDYDDDDDVMAAGVYACILIVRGKSRTAVHIISVDIK